MFKKPRSSIKILIKTTRRVHQSEARFGDADIKYIADPVRSEPVRLSVEEPALVVLSFHESGSFYQVVGDSTGVNTSTESDAVKTVRLWPAWPSACLFSKA